MDFVTVFAYLDPGTGSFIIQAVIGSVVAGGALIKIYWKKIRSLFGHHDGSEEEV